MRTASRLVRLERPAVERHPEHAHRPVPAVDERGRRQLVGARRQILIAEHALAARHQRAVPAPSTTGRPRVPMLERNVTELARGPPSRTSADSAPLIASAKKPSNGVDITSMPRSSGPPSRIGDARAHDEQIADGDQRHAARPLDAPPPRSDRRAADAHDARRPPAAPPSVQSKHDRAVRFRVEHLQAAPTARARPIAR